tara:strand:+ start:1384 stop:2559 length:1176 start_codon:yes stop_codon:yes gene_type:complete
MARDDYWNRGRREGVYQGTSALDTLTRLLGIGSNIAGRVQANRDKRSDVYKVRMAGLLDSGQNKEPLHLRTFDNNIIDELKDSFIKTMGEGIKSTNLETRELYEATLRQFEDAKKMNNDYQIDREYFANAENELIELVRGFRDVQGEGLPGAKRKEMMQDIENKINQYSKKKMEFTQKFGTKLSYDPDIVNDMSSMIFTSKKFLTLAKGDELGETSFITDRAYEMLMTGLTSDNLDIAAKAVSDYDNFSAQMGRAEISTAQAGIELKMKELADAKIQLNNYTTFPPTEGSPEENETYMSNLYGKVLTAEGQLGEYLNDYYTATSEYHIEDPRKEENYKDYKNQFVNNILSQDFQSPEETIQYIENYTELPQLISDRLKNEAILFVNQNKNK